MVVVVATVIHSECRLTTTYAYNPETELKSEQAIELSNGGYFSPIMPPLNFLSKVCYR